MAELAPGAIFAGHRIEEVAGRGGMGVVYRATQLALDRTVALKVIAPGLMEDGATRHRFVRESKVAASLDHPNVIPIYYAGEERGIAYIAMRYVGGHDLRTLVRAERRLQPARAARIVAQVSAGLDAAHAAGLVHRDVKPANVLLAEADHVYLTDFGLTKHALSVGAATKPGQWVGTLDYVSPEQIRGERVDARADVYALGCVLFYALTGRVPFDKEGEEAKLWAHLTQPPPAVSERAPNVPEGLDAVIERALAKRAGERYPSAGDLGRAALAAVADEPVRERERIVAMGPAAPVESPTITSGRQADSEAETIAKPASRAATLARPDDEDGADQREPAARPRRRGRNRRATTVSALAVALVFGGLIAGILLLNDDEPRPNARNEAPATPTAQSPQVFDTVKSGRRPNGIAVADGNVFVISFGKGTMNLLSARTMRAREAAPDIGPGASDIHAADGSVWVTVGRGRRTLVRLSAKSGRRIGNPIQLSGPPTNVTSGRGDVWVGQRTTVPGNADTVLRIDPRTGRTLNSLQMPGGVEALAYGADRLWVLNRRYDAVQAIDPASGQITRTERVGAGASWLAYGAGAIWTANSRGNSVSQLRVRSGDVVTIGVGSNPNRIAVRGNDAWVSNYNDHTLTRINARTSRVVGEPVPVGVNPYALAITDGSVWVTNVADDSITRVDY
jgi:serine/threonine protein kinase/DNA-binding beta-propeller fold protein YncE